MRPDAKLAAGGMREMGARIVAQEGYGALMRGYIAALLGVGGFLGVYFVTFELSRRALPRVCVLPPGPYLLLKHACAERCILLCYAAASKN